MSEPAVQPPVPKPRVNRPLTSPSHPQGASTDPESLRPPSSQGSQESSRTPSPAPKPVPETTEENPPTDGNEDDQPEGASTEDHNQHVLHCEPDHHHGNDEEYVEYDEQDDGDYENIDALLDEDEQKLVRRSDYLNWVYVDDDVDDVGGAVGGASIAGRNPPSVKLSKHPALKKSQSNNDMGSPSLQDALALKKQFEQHLKNLKASKEGARPKNRAPPPPPGSKQRGDRSPKANRNSSGAQQSPSLQARSDRGHKRSQSDVRAMDYPEREHEGESRQNQGEGRRGVVAPPTSGAVARAQQPGQQRSPHTHSKMPHRNKPPDPPPQFQRKHSPNTQSNNSPSHPPPPNYAPPLAPSTASSSGRPASMEVGQKTTPSASPQAQHTRRPHPPKTGGQRGQSSATGQDKANKDKERAKGHMAVAARHPPPPPSSAVATASSASSSSVTDDDRARGRGNRPQQGDERIYDHSPKTPRKQGAERVYELLSKSRNRERPGHSPSSTERQTSASGESGAIYAKPKRHAPPPPVGGAAIKKATSVEVQISEGPPDYSAVVSSREGKPRSETVQVDTRPPPKPFRQRRARSIEDLTEAGLETMAAENQNGIERSRSSEAEAGNESVLSNMEVFTIELRKDGEHSLGLMIVSGKARNSNGDTIEGVFVQKVLPSSLADKDGRIQPGDMLVEIADQSMVGGALDSAIELLQETRESIRLKIGRPDITSAVFAVQGGEEQPINETLERVSPTERDLMMKLEKSQLKVAELEGEREKAEKELRAFKEKAKREEQALRQQLKEMQEMLDSKKAENETTVLELTQTLATVTVEKTKVEKALEERKNEVESLRQRLSDITGDKATVDEILKQTNLKLQETEDELGQIKTEKSALWTELVSGRERISDLEEKLKAAEANNATLLETITEQAEEISSLKAELGRPSEIPRLPPPLPVKSAAPKPAEEEAPPTAEKKPSTGDDDAFDEGVQSPVAPCPYLSFVPLQDDPRSRHKKGKDSEGTKSKKSTIEASKKSSDQSPPSVETGKEERGQVEQASVTEDEQKEKEATAVDDGEVEGEATTVAEQQDQEQDHTEEKLDSAVPLPEFDLVKPLHKLDSRAALHKSQVGGQIKRKKPSRDHLRQMGSSSNLLDSIPDEQMKEPSPPAMTEEEPATKESEEKEKEKEKESEPSTKQQSAAVEAPSPTAAPVQPPKPKPRAAPRKRNPDPTSPTSESSKPHAVPRQKSEAKELSPLPPDGEKSSGERVIDNDSEQKTEESQSTVGAQSSPSIQRKEASKAPHSPKHPPSPKKEHGSHENEDHTPKPLPRGHGKAGKEEEPSSNDDKMAELMKKDPSELTVKEKALLAQRTVGALGHDKTKLPPPVPRKPKPGQGGGGEGEHSETGSDHERGRSQSIDEKESRPSPSHGRRKLPPGAVNIMAGLAASAAERGRCNTVSTTEPGARERNSLERNAALQDHLPEHGASQDGIEHMDHSTKPLPRVPPKRPPLPMQKKPSNEVPSRADDSVDGVESDSSPSLERKVNDVDDETPAQDESHDQSHDREEEDEVDLNTILTWNPNVVGLWLESVGLGQYREAFAGVQGFMLIDMDGHRLKGLGMTSHDDRNSFKKEVKNLKPYADKHKKLLEKQRKEEKKNAKKKKK